MKNSGLIFASLGWLYKTLGNARRKFYEKGFFKSAGLNLPTISVGNITTGGTGKTPLVAYAAQVLTESGERVCILTRGYKRQNERERIVVSDGEKILADAAQSGDEPFELANKLLNKKVSVIADANRRAAGNWARENLNVTAFVLDDGFQHLKVRRDLDIICIDATSPFGNGKNLSAGLLREPLSNLSRADVIVITRANLTDEKQIAEIKNKIANFNQKAKIFVAKNKIASLKKLKDFNFQSKDSKKLSAQRSTPSTGAVFCALGNPESFFDQLKAENFNLVDAKKFPDHHSYTQKDVDELEKTARAKGAELLLTTAKDAVKLQNLKFSLPCLVVESEMIFDDEESLRKLIVGQISRRRRK